MKAVFRGLRKRINDSEPRPTQCGSFRRQGGYYWPTTDEPSIHIDFSVLAVRRDGIIGLPSSTSLLI